jgi:serine/threonine protein kinase
MFKRRFGDSQPTLGLNDPVPFNPGYTLGHGGFGVVVETVIGDIPVAWKRTFTRRSTKQYASEVKILEKILEERHEHVVSLIGSYTHRQRSGWELGILVWPVAQCDLSAFLHDVDVANTWNARAFDAEFSLISDDELSPLANLDRVLDPSLIFHSMAKSEVEGGGTHVHSLVLQWIYEAAIQRLFQSLGCIAEAVRYLHDHGIRHKDLKPSQILLSSEGLWLTDFGWSRDVSELSNSATSGGDKITIRYHAPERANMGSCGRPEDFFALGCTYLEMGYRIYSQTAKQILDPEELPNWSFRGNLRSIDRWLAPFTTGETNPRSLLGFLIQRMMAYEPQERPSIEEVIHILLTPPPLSYGNFFGKYCSKLQRKTYSASTESDHYENEDSSMNDSIDDEMYDTGEHVNGTPEHTGPAESDNEDDTNNDEYPVEHGLGKRQNDQAQHSPDSRPPSIRSLDEDVRPLLDELPHSPTSESRPPSPTDTEYTTVGLEPQTHQTDTSQPLSPRWPHGREPSVPFVWASIFNRPSSNAL